MRMVKTTLGVIIAITLVTTIVYTVVLVILPRLAEAAINRVGGDIISRTKGPGAAPIATSGNNIYIAWSANTTGNDEVMFRASSDGGKTFGEKINLSNTPKSESQDAQIDTFGNNGNGVIVTWWERNATSNQPVLRTSTDNGATFDPILKLATNGTVATSGSGK